MTVPRPAFLTANRRALASVILAATLAAMFLAGGVALRQGYRAEDAARAEVQRSRGLLRETSDLRLLLLEAETAQQAFRLSADPAALAAFETARDRLPALLIALEAAAQHSQGTDPAAIAHLADSARARMRALGDSAAGIDSGRTAMAGLATEIEALRAPELARLNGAFAVADQERIRVRLALAMIGVATVALVVFAAFLLLRIARAEARLKWLARIAAERDRADLVSRELSHRVKNLFAVILSIISLTARSESDPKIAAQKSRLRIQALARAYELSSQNSGVGTAELGDLIRAVVGAYAPSPERLFLHGDPLVLPPRLMTPVGLIVNELATNALKYGAWAGEHGTLSISWAFGDHHRLHLTWAELGDPPRSRPRDGDGQNRTQPGQGAGGAGFGSTMIELSLQQATGRMERHWGENGLTVGLQFDMDPAEASAAGKTGA